VAGFGKAVVQEEDRVAGDKEDDSFDGHAMHDAPGQVAFDDLGPAQVKVALNDLACGDDVLAAVAQMGRAGKAGSPTGFAVAG